MWLFYHCIGVELSRIQRLRHLLHTGNVGVQSGCHLCLFCTMVATGLMALEHPRSPAFPLPTPKSECCCPGAWLGHPAPFPASHRDVPLSPPSPPQREGCEGMESRQALLEKSFLLSKTWTRNLFSCLEGF